MIEFSEPILLAIEAQCRSATAVAKRRRYLDLLRAKPNELMLDVGCGSGSFCRTLAPAVAPDGRVVGIDVSSAAVALAVQLSVIDDAPNLSFSCADGHDLPFPDESFDAAVCISVLAYCDDPARVLAEIRRVLRPAGRLLVASADEDTRIFSGRDRELGRRIVRAIADRGRDSWLGRRLAPLVAAAGFHVDREEIVVDIEREYAPETSGFIHAHLWRDYLLTTAGIEESDYDRWLVDLEASARDGTYCYSVVTYAYLAFRDEPKQ
jgi:arsenite methyltransferase